MSLSKGYSLHSEITDVNAEIHENQRAYKTTKAAQNFLTIATTLIYYSFTSVIFAGVSVWAFQDYVFANATNINGLIFTVALVISAPIGLALAKHTNFQAMAKATDFRTFLIRGLIALAILTGIWYEAVSSSSNLQEKAFHAVEHSKSGNAILNSSVSISSGENGELAKASFKLVSCERKLREGKVKDCANSQAAVDTLKEQATLTRDTVAKANVDAITAKQAAMDKERDSHALPAAKAFSGWFNTSLAAGTFIIVIISSLFFELIHLSTVYSERNNLLKQAELRFMLKTLKTEYFNLVGKTYSPNDFKDDQILDLAEMRESNAIHDFHTGIPDPNGTVMDENPEYKITTRGKPYTAPKPGFGFVPAPSNQRFKWQADSEPDTFPTQTSGFGFISPSPLPCKPDVPDLHSKLLKTDVNRTSPSIEPQLSLTTHAQGKPATQAKTHVCTCLNCGETFKAAKQWQKFCSHARKRKPDGTSCKDQYHAKHGNAIAAKTV